MSAVFAPGTLVHARGRDWVVLPHSDGDDLYLRPIGGSGAESVRVFAPLEFEPVRSANFLWPTAAHAADAAAGSLLRDALLLKLRAGAGPFRSFGNLAFEPRAYQLVPLLMALKQDPVRLLIADDVGIGKTIEAGIILRELLDRGEIRRFAILCPPHLTEQWQGELWGRFGLRAEVIHTTTARRLESKLPQGRSVFDEYPFTVVSLDYIKSDARRDAFLAAAPEMVVVDEAHTCVAKGQGKHQRYKLIRGLADMPERNMVLLTATPHSGDDNAFQMLLGLLDREFEGLTAGLADAPSKLRDKLSLHFVQRRREDLAEWRDDDRFPKREASEDTYSFTPAWTAFVEQVRAYASDVVERSQGQSQYRQRLSWWAALALLRCVASSPAAAQVSLSTRLGERDQAIDDDAHLAALEETGAERVLDSAAGGLNESDLEPAARIEDREALKALLATAEKLTGIDMDPKLARIVKQVDELVKQGFRPVIFCRYIATAHYVAAAMRVALGKKAEVKVVTGELAPEEREEAIRSFDLDSPRVLVATDCLSEGINLQNLFNAVVHYDLSWNPTRHEQREGRVDRFGQRSKKVRTLMYYGKDNPVDGEVLNVILRKARRIRDELGVSVPMPDEGHSLSQALLARLLLRKDGAQLALDFPELRAPHDDKAIDLIWKDARDKASRSRYAQGRLKPADVLPEFERAQVALGGEADVERFVRRALTRLDVGVDSKTQDAPLQGLEGAIRERFHAAGFARRVRLAFSNPPADGAEFIHRAHPLVGLLADVVAESALDSGEPVDGVHRLAARSGAMFTRHVEYMTFVAVLRVRHQLLVKRGGYEHLTLVEEAIAVALVAGTHDLAIGSDAEALLRAESSRNLPVNRKSQAIEAALAAFHAAKPQFEALARDRAQALQADHRRVRDAGRLGGTIDVKPVLPVDMMGVYALVPDQMTA
jgi:superfamily II DNA or RNA helicase